jgi:hypothetical protein
MGFTFHERLSRGGCQLFKQFKHNSALKSESLRSRQCGDFKTRASCSFSPYNAGTGTSQREMLQKNNLAGKQQELLGRIKGTL